MQRYGLQQIDTASGGGCKALKELKDEIQEEQTQQMHRLHLNKN